MSISTNNKRIIKNTAFLYIRMLLTLLVGLYTSRVVLQTLGFSDYGLYNVVGGVVALFAFLNGTLTTSTQRFLNYEMGNEPTYGVKKVFSNALLIHCLLILLVLLLAETIGLWFVLNKLNIEAGREIAAFWVYQFSILTACVQIFQLPFMSTMIAHEKMNAYAYVSIYDVIAKLLIVYLLQLMSYDKLILYGLLFMLVQISEAVIYNYYCQKQFEEARIRISYEKELFQKMLSFSGWNLIGNLASVLNGYGLNIVFNLFFGTAVNAARGLSYQVNHIVIQFSNNFQTAVKPQVVTYYANKQMKEMKNLVFNASKFSAFMLLLLITPVVIEADFLLGLWLGDVPEHTAIFVRIILYHSVLISMTSPLIMVLHASGYLKAVAITAGLFNLSLLPINYVLMKLGCEPSVALIVNALACVVETTIELAWLKYYIKFPMGDFFIRVYASVIPLGLVMLIIPLIVHLSLFETNEFLRFFIVGTLSLFTSLFILWKWGLDKSKKDFILIYIKNKIKGS